MTMSISSQAQEPGGVSDAAAGIVIDKLPDTQTVVAGTAGAVHHRQQQKWANQQAEQQAQQAQQAAYEQGQQSVQQDQQTQQMAEMQQQLEAMQAQQAAAATGRPCATSARR